jgi:hypothetical protein
MNKLTQAAAVTGLTITAIPVMAILLILALPEMAMSKLRRAPR